MTSKLYGSEFQAFDVFIPLIRTVATIGFAVAPCSRGFLIIAVSEHLIRSIMVGDDPEILVSDLQNQFPNDDIVLTDKDEGLVAQVVRLINRPAQPARLPLDICSGEFQKLVRDALQHVQAGKTVSYASLAEQIGAADEVGPWRKTNLPVRPPYLGFGTKIRKAINAVYRFN